MRHLLLAVLSLALLMAPSVYAADAVVPERVLGKVDAPVTVLEFVSLTCPHCGEFTTDILPEIEKRYVDTGKVKFILRDFPLDGMALKAASLARCMPAEQFYPFVTVLYKNLPQWAFNAAGPDPILIQYAKLGGLDGDVAKACLNDTKIQDAIVAERTTANQKYNVEATPTFVISNGTPDGEQKITGARSVADFSALLDKALAGKK